MEEAIGKPKYRMKSMLCGKFAPVMNEAMIVNLFDKNMVFVMAGTVKMLAEHIKSTKKLSCTQTNIKTNLNQCKDKANRSAYGFNVRSVK